MTCLEWAPSFGACRRRAARARKPHLERDRVGGDALELLRLLREAGDAPLQVLEALAKVLGCCLFFFVGGQPFVGFGCCVRQAAAAAARLVRSRAIATHAMHHSRTAALRPVVDRAAQRDDAVGRALRKAAQLRRKASQRALQLRVRAAHGVCVVIEVLLVVLAARCARRATRSRVARFSSSRSDGWQQRRTHSHCAWTAPPARIARCVHGALLQLLVSRWQRAARLCLLGQKFCPSSPQTRALGCRFESSGGDGS